MSIVSYTTQTDIDRTKRAVLFFTGVVIKHLPGKHLQDAHAGADSESYRLLERDGIEVGYVVGRDGKITETPTYKWLLEQKRSTTALMLYNLKTGEMAISPDKSTYTPKEGDRPAGVLSHESLANFAFDADNADAFVHLYLRKDGSLTVLANADYAAAYTQSTDYTDVDKALDNIYKAYDALVRMGLPKETPTKTHLPSMSGKIEGTLKSRTMTKTFDKCRLGLLGNW